MKLQLTQILLFFLLLACTPDNSSQAVESQDAVPGDDTAESAQSWAVIVSTDDRLPVGTALKPGETFRAESPIQLGSPKGTVVYVAENTQAEIAPPSIKFPGERISLRRGSVRSEVTKGDVFWVTTPVATVGVRGTDFAVEYGGAGASDAGVAVFEDTVVIVNDSGEELLQEDREARAQRGSVAVSKLQESTFERHWRLRERIADHLIDKYELDLDDEELPIEKILEKVPEHIREKVRQRVADNVQHRRRLLKEAFEQAGVRDTTLPLRERLKRAREVFQEYGESERNRMRRQSHDFLRAQAAFWRARAEKAEERGPGGQKAAEKMRQWADEQEAKAAEIEASAEPTIRTSIRGAGRRVVASPLPLLPASHPLRTTSVRMEFDILVAPGGRILEAKLRSSIGYPGISQENAEKAVQKWRLNPVRLRQGNKTHRLVVQFVPNVEK